MPGNGNPLILLTLGSVVLLLALILVGKMHAFLALIISSMALGLAAGMGPVKVVASNSNSLLPPITRPYRPLQGRMRVGLNSGSSGSVCIHQSGNSIPFFSASAMLLSSAPMALSPSAN